MSKDMDFSFVQFTLVSIAGEACFLNLRQSRVQTAIMLLLGVTKNEHVIHDIVLPPDQQGSDVGSALAHC